MTRSTAMHRRMHSKCQEMIFQNFKWVLNVKKLIWKILNAHKLILENSKCSFMIISKFVMPSRLPPYVRTSAYNGLTCYSVLSVVLVRRP